MTLSLYNINDCNIKMYFWAPDEPQWWATGFNPHYTKPEPDEMVMICSVDFSGKQELYWSLKNTDPLKFINQNAELIFDDQYHTVWIVF